MFTIKYNCITLHTDENGENPVVSLESVNHAFPLTPLLNRIDPEYFQIVDTGDEDRKKITIVQDFLDNIVNNGLFDEEGRKYIPVFAGSSSQRNGQFVVVREDKWDEVVDFAGCGLDLSKLTVGKVAKYLALMMSSVRMWDVVFPDGGLFGRFTQPSIEKFGVFNDVEVPAMGIFDRVTPDKVERMILLALDLQTNKLTDGSMYYVIDDEGLTPSERLQLIKEIEAFTVRAPLIKGLMIPVLKSALRRWFQLNPLLSTVVKDAWGNPQNILDLQVITFKSVFKAWKCVSSWQEYVDRFNARGHQVWVCVQAHAHKASLPYQQIQTLDLTEEEVATLACRSTEYLVGNAQPGDAGKIMGGALGHIVDLVPEIMNDPFVNDQLQRVWIGRVKQLYGGRLLRTSRNLFCAIDTIAVLEGLFGLPVKGVIPAYQAHTSAFKYGKKLGCTRCPHLDHAWAIAQNIPVPREFAGLYCGTTIFYSAHDNTMKLHQMDFDGDHSNVTDDKLLISAAERSQAAYGNVCLLYSAMDSGVQKGCENYKAELKDLCKSLVKAPIGLYANALTKLWAIRNYRQDAKKIACLTRKGNTCIDEAGGHGADRSVGVAEAVLDQQKSMKVLKPLFLAYAKGRVAADGRSIELAADRSNYTLYERSVVDQYSAICRVLVPQTIDSLIDFSKLGKFDHRVLMHNADITKTKKALEGLISDQDGFYNRLTKDITTEEEAIVASGSMKAMPGFKEDRKEKLISEVRKFAEDRGCTLDDAIDLMIFYLFYKTKRSNRFIPSLKRWLFIAFGDMILRNVEINVSFEDFSGDEEYAEEDDELDAYLSAPMFD